jgi:hypothetical protein
VGLAVEVGIVADLRLNDEEGAAYFRELFGRLNGWLPSQNLQPHIEPETLGGASGYSAGMYGYSGLHTLRRIAAYLQLHDGLPEEAAIRDAAKDEVVEAFYEEFPVGGSRFDHLMMHSDAEGLYLPQEFDEVLFPPDELKVPGCMIGSVPQLLAECQALAEAMELPTDLNPEGEELGALLESEEPGTEGWRCYPVESYTCLHLIAACQSSLATGAAVVFC